MNKRIFEAPLYGGQILMDAQDDHAGAPTDGQAPVDGQTPITAPEQGQPPVDDPSKQSREALYQTKYQELVAKIKSRPDIVAQLFTEPQAQQPEHRQLQPQPQTRPAEYDGDGRTLMDLTPEEFAELQRRASLDAAKTLDQHRELSTHIEKYRTAIAEFAQDLGYDVNTFKQVQEQVDELAWDFTTVRGLETYTRSLAQALLLNARAKSVTEVAQKAAADAADAARAVQLTQQPGSGRVAPTPKETEATKHLAALKNAAPPDIRSMFGSARK